MRKFIFSFFILTSLFSYGQIDTVSSAENKLLTADSTLERTQEIKDSLLNKRARMEEEQTDAANKQNIENILQFQKERRAKQKRNAIIRIAIGVGFLLILIIGLRRRGKK